MSKASAPLIADTDWAGLHTAVGNAANVPGALEALFAAKTDAEAREAYWSHLDNEVVVQGQLFEAAEHVIAPIAAELSAGDLTPAARHRCVELLVEIALGEADESDESGDLQQRCHQVLGGSLWLLYGLLGCDDSRVAVGSLYILESVEKDHARLVRVATRLAAETVQEEVRRRALEVAAS